VPDLAYELFMRTFEHNRRSVKFFTALEADAGRAGRLEALVEFYRERAGDDPRFWGRAKRLANRLRDQG
jgi:hypothetical protein